MAAIADQRLGADAALLMLPAGGANIMISGQLEMDDKVVLDEQTARTALGLLQRRHPRARCWVAKTSRGAFLRYAPVCDGEMLSLEPQLLLVDPDAPWTDIASRIINVHFRDGESKGLMAIGFGRAENGKHVVGISVSHAVSDMQGAITLLKEYVFCLGLVVEGGGKLPANAYEEYIAHMPTCDLPLPTMLIDEIPPSHKGCFNFLFRGGMASMRATFGMSKLNDALVWDEPGMDDMHCRITQRALSAADTSALIALAKAHNTTVHAALSAAMVIAMQDHVQLRADVRARAKLVSRDALAIPFCTTIDARRRIRDPAGPIPPDVVSNQGLGVSTCVKLSWDDKKLTDAKNIAPSAFWELAHRIIADINVAIARKDYAFITWIGEQVPLCLGRRMMADLLVKPMVPPCIVGNNGLVSKLPTRGGVELVTLDTSFASFARSAYLAAATYNGVLSFNVCSIRVAQSQLEFMADGVLAVIRQIIAKREIVS